MAIDAADAPELTPADRDRLAALRSADGLTDLVGLTDAPSEHAAYFQAKSEWFDLRGRELAADGQPDDPSDPTGQSPDCAGLPGTAVAVDGRTYHVHGVTHADTDEERDAVRAAVEEYGDDGATVYCEQGIRSMYLGDFEGACAMDDTLWAMAQSDRLDEGQVDDFDEPTLRGLVEPTLGSLVEPTLSGFTEPTLSGLAENLDDVPDRVRETAFSLIDSGSDVYGERFRNALGDVASTLLTSHEELATGEDFEAFTRTQAAATDPDRLAALQRYYQRRFLPQPVEREWLRRHDPELELVTHARNERMADYAVYHADAPEIHLIVGAAHQPGVAYYLRQFRDGERRLDDFEPVA